MPDTHDTRDKDLKLVTAPRQPAPDEILRARPVKGEIDQKALTRKIIARFPKILAKLAE